MSNKNLTIFAFESKNVRTIVDGHGAPWFVLRDVLVAMESSTRPAEAKAAIAEVFGEGVVNSYPLQTAGGVQSVTLINESALTYLLAQGRTEAGRRLNRFIHAEVLPSIRKTGSYSAVDPMQVLNDPEAMRGLLLSYTEKVIELRGQVEVLEPKAKALDRISDTSGSLNITEAAKALGLQPKWLFSFLFTSRWIYRRNGSKNWLGYQDRCAAGLLEHKVTSVMNNATGEEVIREQVRVTPKGLARLATMLETAEVA